MLDRPGPLMKPRPWLACALAFPGLLSFAAGAMGAAPEREAPRPNIVLIISDDHAWTDYGFMGHPIVKTPHLDRLAREGLAFSRGYVPASLCCPSLASIITGRYPHQHKITCNDPPKPETMTAQEFRQSPAFTEGRDIMNRHLEAAPTLPRRLRELGYLTLQTGKWWQGHYRTGGFTHGMTQGQRHGDEGLEIGRKTMQPIYDFIATAQAEKRPFFVWYAPMMPHEPHTPPERLFAKYTNITNSVGVARYWAMIEWFDETVGALLDHLDQRDLARNTIVLYLADNGWIQRPDAPGYAPKSKQSPYDGGLRTPILLRWPGRVTPGRSEALATSVDLLPTLWAALGQPPDPALPGINLLDDRMLKARKRVFGECFTHNAIDLNDPAANLRWRWVIEDHWKLIVPNPANEPRAALELYDLRNDPFEERNLARREAASVLGLRTQLDGWWDPAR
jgi:uncharacterized sulfatase